MTEKPLKIILDTDAGGDCDDVGAISLLNVFARRGLCEVLCMTYTASLAYGPLCVDAINRFYGHGGIEVGACRLGRAHWLSRDTYAEKLCAEFPNRGWRREDFPESVALMRRKLAENTRVKLLFIGQLNNLCDLLESPPDAASRLSGSELVKESVSEVVVMGGNFRGHGYRMDGCVFDAEYNICSDIPSARKAVDACPVPMTFVDFELGYGVKSFSGLVKREGRHPVRTAYRCFGVSARESWDPVTVMYGVLGTAGLYGYSPWGRVTVQPDGQTRFTEGEGLHRYLIERAEKSKITEFLDNLIE